MSSPKYFSVFYSKLGYEWHHEDAQAVSAAFPIYAVADGVTLPVELYPNIGPRVVAETFCREAINYLEDNFANLDRETIIAAYLVANRKVGKYNSEHKYSFAATAAAAVIKEEERKIIASRVTDCGLALVREGKIIFKTPEFWSHSKHINRAGYGIISGQGNLENYIDFYDIDYNRGDFLALFTDGFEHHFAERNFVTSFLNDSNWTKVKDNIERADRELLQTNAEKYGAERTLVVAYLEK